ncbi:hypothetical protein C8F01DRAFT_1365816 [Mycena amicta]|nr:hypothetical protein C8F01DRAFT_1365816 [Mycena amicta]
MARQPKKRIFSPSDIYMTFKTISDADLHLLGLSDNRNGWSVLPVPPPPSLRHLHNLQSPLAPTSTYWWLADEASGPHIGVDGGRAWSEDDIDLEAFMEMRQPPGYVNVDSTYIDNIIAGEVRTTRQVDSRQLVITGDRSEGDEVGVPWIAPHHVSYLHELVRNGPTAYPGAV